MPINTSTIRANIRYNIRSTIMSGIGHNKKKIAKAGRRADQGDKNTQIR